MPKLAVLLSGRNRKWLKNKGKISPKRFDRCLSTCYIADVMSEMKEKIIRLREKLRLSQEAFARRLRISSRTVYRWETGEYEPIGLYAEKLERMFKKYLANDQEDA